jgi:hypothetical protein
MKKYSTLIAFQKPRRLFMTLALTSTRFQPNYDPVVDVRQRDLWITQEKVQKVAYYFFAAILSAVGISVAGAAMASVIPVWNVVLGLVASRFAVDSYLKADKFDGMMSVADKEALVREAPNLTFKQLESRVRLIDVLHYNILSVGAVRQKLLSAMYSDPLDPAWIRKDDVTRQPRAQEFLDEEVSIIDRDLYNALTNLTRRNDGERASATNRIRECITAYAARQGITAL